MEPRESNLENPWNLKGKRERVPGGTSDEQVGNIDMNKQQPLSLFPVRFMDSLEVSIVFLDFLKIFLRFSNIFMIF